MSKTVFIITGEPSGDLHGANLIRALRRLDPSLSVKAVGGIRMKKAGADLIYDIGEISVVGFLEVLKKLPLLRRVYRRTFDAIKNERPSCVIFIDYPGFNLRLAKDVHRLGIKTVYYILPQIWAWGKSRIHDIKKHLDKVLVIFPFEAALCKDHDIDVAFVGHPLLEAINPPADARAQCAKKNIDPARPFVAILPGSRAESIRHNLPLMLEAYQEAAKKISSALQAIVIKSPYHDEHIYKDIIAGRRNVILAEDPDYAIRSCATAAISALGTANLEMAILKIPTVVAYRTHLVNFVLGRSLVGLSYVSLINIVAGKKVVEEFLQHQATPVAVGNALAELIQDASYRATLTQELTRVKEKLGESGASQRAAQEILNTL